MSGGVDSAAAAQLALDAGDEVVAVTLELWADPATDGDKSCCSPQAVLGARDLAQRMGIPHVTLDLRERFRAEVVDHFLDGYAAGRTPNPCVRCNGEVRFDAMLELADALGAARLATGHYARIARDEHGPLDPRCRRSRQGPELHARQARPRAARPAQLPARRPHEGRRPPARARRRAAGGRQAREPGPLLRRRPRRPRVPSAPRRPAPARARRHRRPAGPRARPPRGPPQLHRRPAPRPRRRDARAALRAGEGRDEQPRGGRTQARSSPRGTRDPRERHPSPPCVRGRERAAALPRRADRLPRIRARRRGAARAGQRARTQWPQGSSRA